MQLQLKQVEIVEALKQYIAKQGLNLVGKNVKIAFTAGRKEAGLSADIVIEDAGNGEIPGFTDTGADTDVTKPVLSVVKTDTPAADASDPQPAATQVPDAAMADEPAVKAAATSLFG